MLKPNVLRNKKDFATIYKKGKSFGDKYVVLFFKKNGLSINRTAFLASKKVGNSVKRNKARRLMKESYRFFYDKLGSGYDFIIIARNTINEAAFKNVDNSMKSVFTRSKLLKNEINNKYERNNNINN